MFTSLLLETVVSAAVAGGPAEPTVLVSGYPAHAVFRYDGANGNFVDTLDRNGGITGPLGVHRRLLSAAQVAVSVAVKMQFGRLAAL